MMQPLSNLASLFLSRWTTSFAGVGTASLLVWYLGPLVRGMSGTLPRTVAVVILVLAWAGINTVLSWSRRRRNRVFAAAIAGDGGGRRDARETQAEATEEVAALRVRMRQALDRLGKGRGGRHLYERPWFVLIGPPGSGKTTALRNSGLHFPLDREGDIHGGGSLGGIGGTRLCDWWFADEAVLIDTAGRYTTHDSDVAVDKAGWLGFLDLLRGARPRQPVNGVIVVISLAELADADPDERTAHARAIRRRIDEINDRLRVRVPVYVLFSKADRLAGFDAYFDDLDAEGRAQVWGATFPLGDGVDSFSAEFRLLLERLEGRLVERLQSERSADRRAQIAGFPLQVASLAQPLAAFMTEAFTGSRLDPAPFLRGAYMTSATQEGTPVDRLTGILARSFGVDQKRAPSLRPVAGRSYFVSRLLREVILGEALLVSRDPARERRGHWLRLGGFTAVGLATMAGALLLWSADMANRLAVEHADEALAAYRQRLATLTLDPVTDDDLPHLVPMLDAAAALPVDDTGWSGSLFGLSQAARLHQSAGLADRHVLERVLLPRLIWRLEQQMRARFDDPDFLYQATRVYLMLGNAGPLDRGLVRNWMQADWASRYPGALNASMRAHLLMHLDTLLAGPLPGVTLDGALVEASRATFSRVSLAQRVYSRVRDSDAAQNVTDWSPARALGAAGTPLFVRSSGKPLTDSIPGFLTAAGFRDVLEQNLSATTHAVADESWVLGHAQEIPTEGPAVAALEQAVIGLWAADVQKVWDSLLADLELAPFEGHDRTVQELYVLSSPQSPIRQILSAIAQRLTVVPQPASGGTADGSRLPVRLAGGNMAQAAPIPMLDPALRGFSDHYQPLRNLLAAQSDGAEPGLDTGAGSATPLDTVLHLVNVLQQELAQTASGTAGTAATLQGSGDPAQLLMAEATRQPVPLANWLRQIAAVGTVSLGSAAQSAASSAFSASDGPGALCRNVVDGRYPFDPGSRVETPIDDFARLFAPNGLLDGFFQAQLRPYVDTGGAVWRPHAIGGVQAPVDAATVAQFQRVAAIRDSFFPTGGNEPVLRFSLTLQPGSSPAMLHLGSVLVPASGSASTSPVSLTWPGTDGITTAILSIDGLPAVQESGQWALFRILDHGRTLPEGDPEHVLLEFDQGGRSASFGLQAGSSRNPFNRNLLRGFHCPVLK